jgi:hypothetical protein
VGSVLLLSGMSAGAQAAPTPDPAASGFGITDFLAGVVTDQDGDRNDASKYFTPAAGRPPFGITEFAFANTPVKIGKDTYEGDPLGSTRNIRIDIPAGLTPNPKAFPTCTEKQLDATSVRLVDPADPFGNAVRRPSGEWCPPESQVGVQLLRIRGVIAGGHNTIAVKLPLYNMERGKDQVARFAFNPRMAPLSHMLDGDLSPVNIIGGVRPSDNGLFFKIQNLPKNPAVVWSKLVFWGVPGATIHDGDRGYAGMALLTLAGPTMEPDDDTRGGMKVADKTTAFLSNPSSCAGPQTTHMVADSYPTDTRPSVRRETSYTTPVGASDCNLVPFSSTTTFGESSMQRDAPVPLSVSLNVPQSQDSTRPATAHVKRVAVTLPPGMTISPSAANGLEACTDDQLAKGTDTPVACPASSRVGAVQITSPVLDDPLTGSVYIGQPLPGQRYRLFLAAESRGIHIRLKGAVTADPATGQLTTVFDDNPQLPFSQLKLDFDGGSRAIIASPRTCGPVEGSSALSPWSGGAASTTTPGVTVVGCDGGPFAPIFGAASANPQAGKYAPLSVAFGRGDGAEFLSGVSAILPKGMTAKIKGVARCAEAAIAAEACPADARIGTVSVKAGPGAAPYALSGPVYLTDGYKGGSYGMAAIVHVAAGPYDLGNVVVRQALRIDPETAQVTVDSDPLPQIKEGVVLRMRELVMHVDRRDFLRNPTSCGPATIGAAVRGSADGVARPTANLTVTGCESLPFRPKLAVALRNKSQMRKGAHPRLTATVAQRESEAGLRSAQVALPTGVALQASNAESLCEKADAARDACPKTSIVGSATAETTILGRKLFAPVYFVKGTRRTASGKEVATLPTLYVPLAGDGVRVNLRGETSVSHGRLVTTFGSIPDQPITTFTLNIDGGKRGIIAATRDLCAGRLRASARFSGWNGKKAPTRRPVIATACATAR